VSVTFASSHQPGRRNMRQVQAAFRLKPNQMRDTTKCDFCNKIGQLRTSTAVQQNLCEIR